MPVLDRYTHFKLAQAEASPSSSGPDGQQMQPLLPLQGGGDRGSSGVSTSRFDPRITGKSVFTAVGLSARSRAAEPGGLVGGGIGGSAAAFGHGSTLEGGKDM